MASGKACMAVSADVASVVNPIGTIIRYGCLPEKKIVPSACTFHAYFRCLWIKLKFVVEKRKIFPLYFQCFVTF